MKFSGSAIFISAYLRKITVLHKKKFFAFSGKIAYPVYAGGFGQRPDEPRSEEGKDRGKQSKAYSGGRGSPREDKVFDLQFSTELSHYTLLSTHTAALVLSLWVLVLANGLITVPKANQVFATLRVRLFPERVGAWADDDVLHMGRMHLARCVVGQPLFMGAWLSLPFLWDREIFVWYFETALSLFPNYGDPVPWAVNAILGIWLVRTARSAWAVIREHGFLFGLLLRLPVAVTTFAAGFFGSVYVLVPRIAYLVLANRN